MTKTSTNNYKCLNTLLSKNIAETYLKELRDYNIDTLILGCTHYPIMANTIQDVLFNHIELIYSGKTVGIKLKEYLKNQNCENSSNTLQSVKYFVTDFPQKFDELGSRFLGRPLINVTHIPIV